MNCIHRITQRHFLLLFIAAVFLAAGACKKDTKKPEPAATNAQDPQLAQLNELLAKDPQNDTLLYLRAEAFYKLDAYDEAMADLYAAMLQDSMQPQYYHLLADVLIDYARPNDSKRAIDILQLASKRFPNRIPTLLKLSEFQLIVQQHSDALSTLNKILEQDPQNAEAFFMTGRVALDMGDTTRAIGALQKAVKLDADNGDAWYFLGRIFMQRGNPLAIQYFDNALRIDSTNMEAREFKGVFYKKKGQLDKALEVYRDIIVRNPDYSNAYFDMGAVYLEKDSVLKAYNNFDLAIKVDPLFVKAFYFRGYSSELLGNKEAAVEDYKNASKMAPDFVEAKESWERLEKELGKNGMK